MHETLYFPPLGPENKKSKLSVIFFDIWRKILLVNKGNSIIQGIEIFSGSMFIIYMIVTLIKEARKRAEIKITPQAHNKRNKSDW